MEVRLYTVSLKGIINKRYEVYMDDELLYTTRKDGFFSFGSMILEDAVGNQLAKLHRNLAHFGFKYHIHGEFRTTDLTRKLFSNIYTLHTHRGPIQIVGNFLSTEFTFSKGEKEIAKVSRKMWRSHRAYGMAIMGEQDDVLLISVLMCIIKIREQRRNN